MSTDASRNGIFDAVQAGDAALVRTLLTADPRNAAARNAEGLPVLLFARYRGALEIVDLLLGADQPLDVFEAAATGRSERVAELLRADPALAVAYAPDGFTALQLAAFFGQPGVARVLLDAGAEVNAVARNAFTIMPLHSACAGQHYEVIELLLQHGADLNAKQQSGFTPLHEAAHHGDRRMVDMLLAAGADRAVAKDDGKTPADVATDEGHVEIARLLGA